MSEPSKHPVLAPFSGVIVGALASVLGLWVLPMLERSHSAAGLALNPFSQTWLTRGWLGAVVAVAAIAVAVVHARLPEDSSARPRLVRVEWLLTAVGALLLVLLIIACALATVPRGLA